MQEYADRVAPFCGSRVRLTEGAVQCLAAVDRTISDPKLYYRNRCGCKRVLKRLSGQPDGSL